jgi:hypothetical protein
MTIFVDAAAQSEESCNAFNNGHKKRRLLLFFVHHVAFRIFSPNILYILFLPFLSIEVVVHDLQRIIILKYTNEKI